LEQKRQQLGGDNALNWNSTTAGYPPTGSLPITRATTLAGTTCP